jgi:hypothetical protein
VQNASHPLFPRRIIGAIKKKVRLGVTTWKHASLSYRSSIEQTSDTCRSSIVSEGTKSAEAVS